MRVYSTKTSMSVIGSNVHKERTKARAKGRVRPCWCEGTISRDYPWAKRQILYIDIDLYTCSFAVYVRSRVWARYLVALAHAPPVHLISSLLSTVYLLPWGLGDPRD